MMSLSFGNELPKVYVSDELLVDTTKKFEDILKNLTVKEALDAFSQYIGANIDPVGWSAIWRPVNYDYLPEDCILEVICIDFDYKNFIAFGEIVRSYRPLREESPADSTRLQAAIDGREYFECKAWELLVICEDDPERKFAETAALIDMIKIFHHHIIRPWEENDPSYWKTDLNIYERMMFYSKLQSNTIEDRLVEEYSMILRYARELKDKMSRIEERGAGEDAEQTDFDMVRFTQLKLKLAELANRMDILTGSATTPFYFLVFSCSVSDPSGPSSIVSDELLPLEDDRN